MRYSKLFGKTRYNISKQIEQESHKLLLKGGFIAESVAGRYYLLPLGWKVHQRIIDIIKEEMDAIGGQEMIVPVLHPIELWQETNRTNSVGFELMSTEDRRGRRFALGGTAEEMFVDLVRKYNISYKDLPFILYQFSSKFRDEMRARGGLLRVREFVMKDAYSFHANREDFDKFYEEMKQTYSKIFERLGLKTTIVPADNGYIGGDYSHEFQVEHPSGEGKFFVNDEYVAHEDIAQFKREPINPDEELKEMEIIDQPEWVHSMDDNVKHYQLPESRFLKNVVYRNNTSGQLIIAVIRGDLDVNKIKLEQILDAVGQLEEANEQDLAKLGTKPGYVHSWGHEEAYYIGDLSLTTVHNFIGGQKTETTDSTNVNYGRDFECEQLADIAMAKAGCLAPNGLSKLEEKNGIEVGNIFQLGTHYSKKMKGAEFINKQGEQIPFYMGCYGIGIGRTMATIVEKYHDDRGIIWPINLAPYNLHLINIGRNSQAAKLHQQLEKAGLSVLWDDRDESAGVKFKDADLLGIPIRLVISPKTEDKVELKYREQSKVELITAEEVIKLATDFYGR
ncbi:MAG: proline--tRNA ligase [Patescibacteria group bacterium]|nr:proline--tRNA ligase [Patescibacteria group bacterium]